MRLGDRPILLRPPSGQSQDRLGGNVRQQANPYRVYARRLDRGGREGVIADTREGEWSVRFELSWSPSLALADSTWELDEVLAAGQAGGDGAVTWGADPITWDGALTWGQGASTDDVVRPYDVESVVEPPEKPGLRSRRRRLWFYCVNRSR